MDKKQLINQYCRQFKMSGIPEGIDQLVQQAESSAIGYLDYTVSLFGAEARHRVNKRISKNESGPPNCPDPVILAAMTTHWITGLKQCV